MSETPKIDRRSLLLGAAGVAGASLFLTAGRFATVAYAAPIWRHPFTFRAIISPYIPGQTLGGYFQKPWRPSHNGLDYGYGGVTDGTPIYAVASGTVHSSGYSATGFGNWVRINHAAGYQSLYAHMQSPTPLSVGSAVPLSGLVGRVGNTGNSGGAHLHIEITLNGALKDPELLIDQADLAGVPATETEEDEEMKPKVFRRTAAPVEVIVVAPWIPGGFRVVANGAEALAVERMYAKGSNTADTIPVASDFATIKAQAVIDANAWASHFV